MKYYLSMQERRKHVKVGVTCIQGYPHKQRGTATYAEKGTVHTNLHKVGEHVSYPPAPIPPAPPIATSMPKRKMFRNFLTQKLHRMDKNFFHSLAFKFGVHGSTMSEKTQLVLLQKW